MESALDLSVEFMDHGEMTIREYLKTLLATLWEEEESFNGKRPFGNSGWQWEVYAALIRAGHIKGTLDEDGYPEEYNNADACAFVINLIKTM